MWDLPTSVEIDGVSYKIRNDCDFRVVLDCIIALNDNELTEQEKIYCALFIFYEEFEEMQNKANVETAIKEMFKIIDYGEEQEENQEQKPRLMDWEHDFPQIAPPVSRILGYDVRTPDKYTHWYTFLGGYMEIGECTFQNVVSIRNKLSKGKKLEKWEQDFYIENKKMVDLPLNLTEDEKKWLDNDC